MASRCIKKNQLTSAFIASLENTAYPGISFWDCTLHSYYLCGILHPRFTSCRPHTLKLPSTHPVEEVGAAHSSNLADVVHETQVSLSGAVHLEHFNVSKTNVELPPDVLPQPIPDSHPHLVNFVQLSLMEGERCDDISRRDPTGGN